MARINFCDGEWAGSADVTADTQTIYGTKKRLKRPVAALISAYVLRKNGAQGRTRTTDTRIFSPLLYQLSYLGISGRAVGGGTGSRCLSNWL